MIIEDPHLKKTVDNLAQKKKIGGFESVLSGVFFQDLMAAEVP